LLLSGVEQSISPRVAPTFGRTHVTIATSALRPNVGAAQPYEAIPCNYRVPNPL
jgi:hypothetical protein